MDNDEILQAGMDAGFFENAYVNGQLVTALTAKGATIIVVLCSEVDKLTKRIDYLERFAYT